MKRLRVSVVEYLNTAPLVWGLTHGPWMGRYELEFTVPALCADALRAGRVDIGIIPSIEYQRIADGVAMPQMAIAARGPVRSILLLSRKPIEQVRRVALDHSSRSSAALVRVLAERRWGLRPSYEPAAPDVAAMLTHCDAALLIGDPALAVSVRMQASSREPVPAAAPRFPLPDARLLFVYDLAAEWYAWTRLPIVLALWVGRREVMRPEVVDDFLASKAYGLARIAQIAAWAAPHLGLPQPILETYLRENIHYDLDADALAGLERFYQECAQVGLIEQARPLELVPATAAARQHICGGRPCG